MECKCLRNDIPLNQQSELIETLWNVNSSTSCKIAVALTELIETLWNVNLICAFSCIPQLSGINRNIVECKCY